MDQTREHMVIIINRDETRGFLFRLLFSIASSLATMLDKRGSLIVNTLPVNGTTTRAPLHRIWSVTIKFYRAM